MVVYPSAEAVQSMVRSNRGLDGMVEHKLLRLILSFGYGYGLRESSNIGKLVIVAIVITEDPQGEETLLLETPTEGIPDVASVIDAFCLSSGGLHTAINNACISQFLAYTGTSTEVHKKDTSTAQYSESPAGYQPSDEC